MRPSPNYARLMNNGCRHMTMGWGVHHNAPSLVWCSPYPGFGIDISKMSSAHLPDNQGTQRISCGLPVLHIPTPISQNTPPHPSFNSPYQGGDLDITGGTIPSRAEPQAVTASAVRTAVLHIVSPTQPIGADLRQQPAFRVSDRSGTPQAGNPAEEYSGERDPRRIWPRGTPKKNTQQ